MSPISLCVNHFPERKGLITGIILMCLGLSGVLLSVIFVATVNPSNEPT